MFSGCRPQASRAFKGVPKPEKTLNIFYAVSVLRHLWAAHINDQKRNLHHETPLRYSDSHQQRDEADVLDAKWDSVDRWLTEQNLDKFERPEHQQSSTETQRNSVARPERVQRSIHDVSLNNTVEPVPWIQLDQVSRDKHPSEVETRTAKEIERDNKWRERWKKGMAAKELTRTARLRKGPLTYDLEKPMGLVWKESNPVSGLRLRGRLFRLKRTGKDMGVNTYMVKEPVTWTKTKFDEYVYELATVKTLPTPVAQALNSKQGSPVESRSTRQRGAILHELMHRRLLHAFIEPEICNVAIQFLTRHQMIAKARSILLLMEHLNLHIGPSTFNIFLRAAVHQHDLATFTRLLETMKRRGVRRDSATLILLIQCLRSRKDKTEVIRRMQIAGTRLLNRLQRRDLIAATVKQDIAYFLGKGGKPLDFLESMRNTHEVGWINSRIGNIILDQVCKLVSLPAGLSLLEPLRAEGFRPDTVTLQTPLFLARSYNALEKVADILELFASKYDVHPNSKVFSKLWYLAWERHWLNVSALLFVAACINGAVTTEMRNMIFLSFKVNNDLLRTKRVVLFRPSAPNLAPSIDYPPHSLDPATNYHPPDLNPAFNYRPLNPDPATDYHPPNPDPTTEHQSPPPSLHRRPGPELPYWPSRVYITLLGPFILNLNPWRDHSNNHVQKTMMQMIRALAKGQFKLRYSLGHSLRKAYRLDAQWKIHRARDVVAKLNNPYPIPLEPRRGTRNGARVSYYLDSEMEQSEGSYYWTHWKRGGLMRRE